MKPIIGITPSSQIDALSHGTFQRFYLTGAYVRAISAAGGVAIILPPQPDAAAELLDIIDGLLLSGGPDVHPTRYGDDTIHDATYGIDVPRDELEIALVHGALERQIPIFGICRGIQVLNVALGGALIQDVPTEYPGAAEVGHRQHERGLAAWQAGHEVSVDRPDALPFLASPAAQVNSFHHQAIRELSPGLVPVAYSPDGLIEAVVFQGRPDVFAVQWHPEMMFERDAVQLEPFRYFVSTALARKLSLALK